MKGKEVSKVNLDALFTERGADGCEREEGKINTRRIHHFMLHKTILNAFKQTQRALHFSLKT